MPEGPEIRRTADKIAQALVGQRPVDVFFEFDRWKACEPEFIGRLVLAVEPRGKALLTRFEDGLNIYSHNQLYGRWYVTRRGALPRTKRSLRLAIHTEAKSALLYSASEIEVLTDAELGAHPFLKKLGPDVLDSKVRPSTVCRRFRSDVFRRRRLAGLLLDQSFMAGLGNYLRSEILFEAGLGPSAVPNTLEDEELTRLGRAVLTIARRSYRTGGITNDPERARRLKAEGLTRAEFRHSVFGRDGAPCHECGTEIERDTIAGRRLYWCPNCQLDGAPD